MSAVVWIPEALHPVAMRLGRADQLAFELAEVALRWSRGPDDQGPLSLRQVERQRGFLDVEVSGIRPVPPVAATLFSEAIHHLRAAVDNAVFYMVEANREEPLSERAARAVSMLIYEDPSQFEAKVNSLVKQGLTEFASSAPLGRRIASLQPFEDGASVSAIPPGLSAMMGGPEPSHGHPLILLRDYSNEDKHRAIRLAAARIMIQRPDDLSRTRLLGMREMEVGGVVAVVKKGVPTEVDTSPALHVQRPNGGVWVGPGYELDSLTRHVADVVLPTIITGLALPAGLPAQVDLSDTGATLAERLHQGASKRAHDRARELATQAYIQAVRQDLKFPPIVTQTDSPSSREAP